MEGDLLQMGVLSLIALACGLLSPFLVLKRVTMFANSLSHTVLLGIALAFLLVGSTSLNLFVLIVGALIAALLTALCTGVLIRLFRLQEDASVGLVFTSLFALGIIVVSVYAKNVHLGIESVLGNVDLLQISDLSTAFFLCATNAVALLFCYRRWQLMSFDANLAKTMGVAGSFCQFLLLFLTATTCVGAFRAVGVLLVLAFLVGPFLTARLFSHQLKSLLVITPCIGVLASVIGVLVSRGLFEFFGLALSTGGIVTVVIGLIYLFSKWIASIKLALWEKRSRSSAARDSSARAL